MIGVVDIGSNSVRLLITDADGREIERRVEVTALARGVDATGQLSARAIDATVDVVSRYAHDMRTHGVVTAAAVATSAARDAANGSELMALLEQVLGFAPEIIDGEREAALAFSGAAGGFSRSATVIDIGGGSTEITNGEAGEVTDLHSYDIGSVRITDRHLGDAPPAMASLQAARDDVAATFADPEPAHAGEHVIGVAGTFTSLAAMALELPAYDRTRVHGSVLRTDDLARLELSLSAMSTDAIASIPSLDPARAPVILGGTVIAREALSAVGADEVIISERDLLDGLCDELRSS